MWCSFMKGVVLCMYNNLTDYIIFGNFILILSSSSIVLEKLVKESKALEKAIAGEELSYDDGMELMSYDNLYMLGAAADLV